MNYEVLKSEPLTWRFHHPPNYLCPVCGKREADTKIYLGDNALGITIQLNICNICSSLDGAAIINKAMRIDN